MNQVAAELDTLHELLHRPRWWERAKCPDRPDVSFFIGRGGDAASAKAVCRGCPVRVDCIA